MDATVVIPARLQSSRFPEKVLADRTGKPLVQHAVDQVRRCTRVREIIVAADSQRVADRLKPFGTRVVITDPDHPSGTDRIAEVARQIDDGLIINVQGDEPEIEPETVDLLIERMQHTGGQMGTVVTPFSPPRSPSDPNIVKAVLALDGSALYFSRHAIPFDRDQTGGPTYFHHLGVYAYRRDFLLEFSTWQPTPLEQAEKLEQLRALEHGVRIDTVRIASAPAGIDTAEQYEAFVRRYMNKEPQMSADARG